MKSAKRGRTTSDVELANVSAHGLWILVGDEKDWVEHFLPFDDFPRFRDATIGQLGRIERPAPDRFRWPEIDVEVTMEDIERSARADEISLGTSKRR